MSLFGGSTAFSSNAQSQAKPAFSLNATQPQQTGGLFGSTTTSQPQIGGSLFGAPTSNAQPQQQSGVGLFGLNTNSNTTQPVMGGSLFSSAQASQPQQSGGLFGSAQPQQSSLFGSKPAQTMVPAASQTSFSLFGNVNSNNSNSQQQQQQQQAAQSSTLPSLSLGQTNRQPQTVTGVRIDASNIRSTTRFNDLHEDLQAQIEKIDTFIQQQIHFKEQCKAMMPSHEENIKTIPEDVKLVNGLVDTSEQGILNDSTAIKQARDLLQADAETARISFRATETLKLPTQLRNPNTWYSNAPRRELRPSLEGPDKDESQPQDIVDYFATEGEKMTATLQSYENYIAEIEGHLQTVENSTIQASRQMQFTQGKNGGGRSSEDQVRELAAVLREFESGIYGIAAKIGNMRDETQKLSLQSSRRR